MKRTAIFILTALSLLTAVHAGAQVRAVPEGSDGIAPGKTVIVYDVNDAEVVSLAAGMVADDILRVCGRRPRLATSLPAHASTVIIAGTVGQCAPLDRLAAAGRIDVSGIAGEWERYAVRDIRNPFPGIRRAIVIAGSDRRGTAYGLLSISEAAGVSPWYWWADVPVPRKPALMLSATDFDSHGPSVKYRGIFINDEDWGLLPWASGTFEPEEGSIGPKTYEKVCELLLRLKANYLCPAMHRRSKAFNENPENRVVADRYAIVMGSVHCEPLLYNNAREWDKNTMGPWNYETNKDRILEVLRDRVESNGKYENVYTLALRGLHDKAMEGSSDLEKRKAVLEEALEDQRKILSDIIGKPLRDIPQAFTPYKEVLDLYELGLKLPDEVTIIWPDDNYGYMKRLCNPSERLRSGRGGVYYHVSYHGRPHDYLWLDTTSPALMYEELDKAFRTGSDRIWLVNCGDLKFCEYGTDLFLRMAYDIDAFSFGNIMEDKPEWLASMFGEEHSAVLGGICKEFFSINFPAKPEYMGWGQEWNRKYDKQASVTDTGFSFLSYREAQTRLERCEKLARLSTELYAALPQSAKPAYFELVHYPVLGTLFMNRMHLDAQKSRLYRLQGRASAPEAAMESLAAYDSLKAITERYNSMLSGKWKGAAALECGATANYYRKPDVDTTAPQGAAGMKIFCDGMRTPSGGGAWPQLPCFSKFYPARTEGFEVCNTGGGQVRWSATASEPWIILDRKSGCTRTDDRVTVSIDWDTVPSGEAVAGTIKVTDGARSASVLVSVFNPVSPSRDELAGMFVEDDGVVSIPAAMFHRKSERNGIVFTTAPGLASGGDAVRLGDCLQTYQSLKDTVACLEYDFYCFDCGSVDIYSSALPTFPLYRDGIAKEDYAGSDPSDGELRYGISIDGEEVAVPSISSSEYAQAWMDNVLRNSCTKKTSLNVKEPGRHTLRLWCGDPGVIIQNITIDFGGMRKSLLGPRQTIVQ